MPEARDAIGEICAEPAHALSLNVRSAVFIKFLIFIFIVIVLLVVVLVVSAAPAQSSQLRPLLPLLLPLRSQPLANRNRRPRFSLPHVRRKRVERLLPEHPPRSRLPLLPPLAERNPRAPLIFSPRLARQKQAEQPPRPHPLEKLHRRPLLSRPPLRLRGLRGGRLLLEAREVHGERV